MAFTRLIKRQKTELVTPDLHELSPEVLQALQSEFGVGLILGPSGSGKSTMLRLHFQKENELRQCRWDAKRAIISHFETPEVGVAALMDCGLNTIPSWLRPYHILSNGEQRRANLARNLGNGHLEDEFTSELDRRTAMAVAVAVGRRCRKLKYSRVVFASCHSDIARFLQPDWVLWMPHGKLLWNPLRFKATRQSVSLDVNVEHASLDKRSQADVNRLSLQSDQWTACSAEHRSVKSVVSKDEYTELAADVMEVPFNGVTKTMIPQLDGKLRTMLPLKFRIGLIVGPSGTGKSSLLRQFGEPVLPQWRQDVAIADHFQSYEDAEHRLRAVDLRIITSWWRSHDTLSVGEQHRANIALTLASGARIDEFTSTVDRAIAVSIASSISAMIRAHDWTDIVFASCHDDIQEALAPDWIYNVVTNSLSVREMPTIPETISKSSLRSLLPPIVSRAPTPLPPPMPEQLFMPARLQIQLERCGRSAWQRFARYHYLSGSLGCNAMCFVARLVSVDMEIHECRNNALEQAELNLQSAIGFVAALPQPWKGNFFHGRVCRKKIYRESRLVVIPELQGLGLGKRLSESVAQLFVDWGMKYTSKAAHPRVAYRDKSSLWQPLPNNGELCITWGAKKLRRCFNHEFVGMGRSSSSKSDLGEKASQSLASIGAVHSARSASKENATLPRASAGTAHSSCSASSLRETAPQPIGTVHSSCSARSLGDNAPRPRVSMKRPREDDFPISLPPCKWWPGPA